MDTDDRIAGHYAQDDLADRVLEMIVAAGIDPEKLTVEDLGPADSMHVRGKQASLELIALLEPSDSDSVLDVGAGIGGLSRILASTIGCPVTALDLMPEFCDCARMLNHLTGFDDLIEVQEGSALDMPFDDEEFDIVVTQHATMNIPDKKALYEEIVRVMEPGGRFGFYDLFQGPGGDVIYPAPWAETSGISFMADPHGTRDLLGELGLECVVFEDDRDAALQQVTTNRDAAKSRPKTALRPGFWMTGDVKARVQNMGRNIEENRVVPYRGIFRKP